MTIFERHLRKTEHSLEHEAPIKCQRCGKETLGTREYEQSLKLSGYIQYAELLGTVDPLAKESLLA